MINSPIKKKKKHLYYLFILVLIYSILIYLSKNKFTPQGSIDGVYIIICIILYLTSLSIRGIRFQFLVNLEKNVDQVNYSIKLSILSVYMAWSANVFLPGRLGEVIRLFTAEKFENIPKKRIFNSILLEKLFDISSMGIIGLSSLFFISLNYKYNSEISLYFQILGALILFALLFVVVVIKSKLINSILLRIPRVGQLLYTLLSQLKSQTIVLLKNKTQFAKIFGLSLVIWLLDSFTFILLLSSLSIIVLEYSLFTIIIGFTNFILPILPNAAGQFEVTVALIYASFGFDFDIAFNASLWDHIIKSITALALGILAYMYVGISPFNVKKEKINSNF